MIEPPPGAPTTDRYAVLRVRDFRLYLVSRFIVSFAQQMLGVAVGWELFDRTHSALALGLVGLTHIGPLRVVTLPAGHLADQLERRGIRQWSQGFTALSCAGLAAVSWYHAPVFWTYGLLFISGVARAFLSPASGAFLPQIVPREVLADAVAGNPSSFHPSATLGPAAGGFFIPATGGAATVYAFNVVAGLVCCAMLLGVRSRFDASAQRQKMSFDTLAAGVRFVFGTPVILGTITLDLFAVLLGGATSLLPIYASDVLHVGPHGLGWLRAALPAGSVCMALVLAHLPPMRRAGHSLLLAVAGFGAATVVFGFSQSFCLSFAMLFACGATDNISVVVRHTLVQVLTPDAMRGRVSAVNSLFIGASNEFGEFESGVVASWFGPVAAVVSGGVGTVLVVIATALIWPQLRKIGRLDAATATTG